MSDPDSGARRLGRVHTAVHCGSIGCPTYSLLAAAFARTHTQPTRTHAHTCAHKRTHTQVAYNVYSLRVASVAINRSQRRRLRSLRITFSILLPLQVLLRVALASLELRRLYYEIVHFMYARARLHISLTTRESRACVATETLTDECQRLKQNQWPKWDGCKANRTSVHRTRAFPWLRAGILYVWCCCCLACAWHESCCMVYVCTTRAQVFRERGAAGGALDLQRRDPARVRRRTVGV